MEKTNQQNKQNHKKPLCSHIKKLSKKQVTDIVENYALIKCQNHISPVEDSTICLHCNKIFCGQNSKEKCIFTHQKLDQGHIFSLNLQNGILYCAECQQCIQFLVKIHSQQTQSEDLKKLKRFSQFIQQNYQKLKVIHQDLKKIPCQVEYRGLQNLGNTCFLNSDLQILTFSKKLVDVYNEYKFSGNFSKSIIYCNKSIPKYIEYFYDQVIEQGESKIWHVVSNKKQKSYEHNQKLIKNITSCKFNQLLKHFLQEMIHKTQNNDSQHDQSLQPYEPIEILQFLSHLDSKYSFKEQQDAEQALLFMIDILVQGELMTMNYDLQRYKKVQSLIGRQKISPSQRVFGLYLVSQIFCQSCKKINYTFDLTYHLSIDLQSKSIHEKGSIRHHLSKQIQMKQKVYYKKLKYPQNIQSEIVLPQFLQSFFSEQRLTQRDNFYSCSDCKSLVGLKKFYLVDLPQILIISIKRFNHRMIKNSKWVKFDELIDLKDVTLGIVDQESQQSYITESKYRLYGVIVHLGDTIHNGHYICYVRTSQNIWLRCSDHQVKKVSFKEVKQVQAYVLLYEKVSENK